MAVENYRTVDTEEVVDVIEIIEKSPKGEGNVAFQRASHNG